MRSHLNHRNHKEAHRNHQAINMYCTKPEFGRVLCYTQYINSILSHSEIRNVLVIFPVPIKMPGKSNLREARFIYRLRVQFIEVMATRSIGQLVTLCPQSGGGGS